MRHITCVKAEGLPLEAAFVSEDSSEDNWERARVLFLIVGCVTYAMPCSALSECQQLRVLTTTVSVKVEVQPKTSRIWHKIVLV